MRSCKATPRSVPISWPSISLSAVAGRSSKSVSLVVQIAINVRIVYK
jgi:hypothetical protein